MVTDANAFVFDFGHANTYWGYAGDEEPRQTQTSAWCHQTDGWSTCPADFLEFREAYTPCWLNTLNSLPEPLAHYVQHQSKRPDIAEPSRLCNLTGRLSRAVLERQLLHVDKFFSGEPEHQLAKHPLLVTEPTKRSPKHAKALAEVALERIGVSDFCAVRKATLAAMAMGRPTSMVVEMGPVATTVTPVFEGYTLQRHVQQYAVGGYLLDWMYATTMKLWDHPARSFVPAFRPYANRQRQRFGPFAINTERSNADAAPTIHPQYLHQSQSRIVQDLRESTWRLRDMKPSQVAGTPAHYRALDQDDLQYELPDGKVIYMPEATSAGMAEFLLNPLEARPALDLLKAHADQLPVAIGAFPGVPNAVVTGSFGCDVDLRQQLLQNVVVVGGLAAARGMIERIASDLTTTPHVDVSIRDRITPELRGTMQSSADMVLKDVSSVKFKVSSQTTFERGYTTWIGGSILAMLSSFKTFWINSADWAEVGPSILDRRRPF